jgi:uroporphyrinogen decarboxylase
MDGYFPLSFPNGASGGPEWERFIIERTSERIVTRRSHVDSCKRVWAKTVDVFPVAEPAKYSISVESMRLPPVPERFEPVEGVKQIDTSTEGLKRVKDLMGDQGIVGVWLASTCAVGGPEGIYRYYDNPQLHEEWARKRVEGVEKRFAQIQTLDVRPDFLCVGGSGTLVFQTEEMFLKVAFPAVKRGIELATAAGYPTHIHSCGPEKALVKIMAEQTSLTVIDPLEIPPMGDCDLAEIKRLHGSKLTLKGNLHTTDVMLHGSVEDVKRASMKAIDDAAEGGRFILSTGDQCGRDTPDENLRTMVETARTYGRY